MVNDIQGSVFRDAGGVMAYAVGFQEVAARTASFIDRILKGATPGDLPIEQPTQIARMGLSAGRPGRTDLRAGRVGTS